MKHHPTLLLVHNVEIQMEELFLISLELITVLEIVIQKDQGQDLTK